MQFKSQSGTRLAHLARAMGELRLDDKQTLLRALLRDVFSEKTARNANYSLRAFARDLGVDSSTLSHVMAGRRSASSEFIAKVAETIDLPLEVAFQPLNESDFERLTESKFDLISQWYYFAILDLTLLKGFEPNLNWMAKKLSLPTSLVKKAVDNLLSLGLLELRDGTLRKSSKQFTNDLGSRTTEAKKEYQRQLIKMALEAVDSCPPERKDITSMTIACNPAKLELAREMLKNFRRELCAVLEDGSGEDVYHLTLQLYPVTQTGEAKNVSN